MMMGLLAPTVRYVEVSGRWIAYELIGDGPIDLVLLNGPISHLDLIWEEPSCRWFLQELAEFCRVVLFDSSGTGLSDPAPGGVPRPEQTIDDLSAVMYASEVGEAVLFGISGGGCLAALAAATRPDRCAGLVLYGSYAKLLASPDYPWGRPAPANSETHPASPPYSRYNHNWQNPTVGDDPRVADWSDRFLRSAGSPRVIDDALTMMRSLDIRPHLGRIRAPTLVLGRQNDPVVSIDNSRFLASCIPEATLVELDGGDHHPWFGNSASVIDEIYRFLLGRRRPRRGRSDHPRWDLTRREQEVIALALDGLTAHEIGRRLLISSRTVETHIAHAYAKLGITGRIELSNMRGILLPLIGT